MLRIATFNVNGIRAAQRRGFEDWLSATDPDVVAGRLDTGLLDRRTTVFAPLQPGDDELIAIGR